MENNEKVSKLEYPFYTTNSTQLDFKQECKVNPYTEFMYYAFNKYFPNSLFKRTHMNMETLFNMDENAQIALFSSILEPFGVKLDISFKEESDVNKKRNFKSFYFIKDGEEVCKICERNYMESSLDFKYAAVSKRSLRVEFPKNTGFDYLLENAAEFNVYVFNSLAIDEETEGTNQVDMAMCLVLGLANFMDFVKFHKLNLIKINGISSYIHSKEEIRDDLSVEYNYSNAFVMYKAPNGGFSLHVVNYKTYVEDADKMFESILGRKE